MRMFLVASVLSMATLSGVIGLNISPALSQSGTFQADTDWETIAPEGEDFKFTLPGKPQVQSGKTKAGEDTLSTLIYSMNDMESKGAYYVLVMTMPVSVAPDSKLAESALDKAMVAATEKLSTTGSKVIASQSFKLNGYPGKEATIQVQKQAGGKIRFMLVNNRVYGLVAIAENPKNPSIDRFLQSFQLRSKAEKVGIFQGITPEKETSWEVPQKIFVPL